MFLVLLTVAIFGPAVAVAQSPPAEVRFRGAFLDWSSQTTTNGELDIFTIHVDEILDVSEGEEGDWPEVGHEVHVYWATGSNAPQPEIPANGGRVEVFGTVYNVRNPTGARELVVKLEEERHYLKTVSASTSTSAQIPAEIVAYLSAIVILVLAGVLLYSRKRRH
jgi:hypothetical protein